MSYSGSEPGSADVTLGGSATASSTVAEVITRFAISTQGPFVLLSPDLGVVRAAIAGVASHGEGPLVYIADTNLLNLADIFRELCKANQGDEVTLYHGMLRDFLLDIPLSPALLFAGRELPVAGLRECLPPGIPILAPLPVAGGAIGTGLADVLRNGIIEAGTIDSGLRIFRSSNCCRGTRRMLPVGARRQLQGRLHERYLLREAGGGERTFVSDLTEEVRRLAAQEDRAACGYGGWPFVSPESADLPQTLPSGKPWPRISIVTPSYNQGRFLEETILSVLNQNYPNVEHIVCDGGSTDHTANVLERYRGRLAFAVSEKDRGQSHAINKGMARATGEIVTWLNSDDMLAPGSLAAVAMAFDTHDADMVAGICRLYKNGTLVGQHLTSCADGPLPLEALLDIDTGWNAGQFFYQPEVMFRREMWERAGGHLVEDLHFSMDYELWLRFACAGARLHVVGRPLAWFRIHENQKVGLHVDTSDLIRVRDKFLAGTPGLVARMRPPSERHKLRVTLLNDHGAFHGAGIAHARFARCLAWAGHDVSLVSIMDRPMRDGEKAVYKAADVVESVVETRPDLLIVGNLHDAGADPWLLDNLSQRFPTLIMMHDFWIMTGRCAYTGNCEKYRTGCDDSCPTPDEYPALPPAEIAEAWRKKRMLLGAKHAPVLLANSAWTAGFLRQGFSYFHDERPPRIEAIHLSFPLDVFHPHDRRSAREALGLPADRFLVLFPSSLDESRKGGRPFLEALARLKLPNLLMVATGAPTRSVGVDIPLVQLGYVTDPRKLALINSAADLVVVPSVAETFGQVLVEASACGTPALGYPCAGIGEAIRDGVSGILARDTEPASLAAAVQYLYGNPGVRRDLARWGRIYLENEWSEFAAYRHFFDVCRRLGILDSLKLPEKIAFQPTLPPVPAVEPICRTPRGWRPGQGFSRRESSGAHKLQCYWWVSAPGADAEIYADHTGPHTILISFLNPHSRLRLSIRCNGGLVLADHQLPNSGYDSSRVLMLEADLFEGVNGLHLEFSGEIPEGHDHRALAIMVTDILTEPRNRERDLLDGLSEQQMLEALWRSSE